MSTAEQLELDLKKDLEQWGLSPGEARSFLLLLGKLANMPSLHIRYLASDAESIKGKLLELLTELKITYP